MKRILILGIVLLMFASFTFALHDPITGILCSDVSGDYSNFNTVGEDNFVPNNEGANEYYININNLNSSGVTYTIFIENWKFASGVASGNPVINIKDEDAEPVMNVGGDFGGGGFWRPFGSSDMAITTVADTEYNMTFSFDRFIDKVNVTVSDNSGKETDLNLGLQFDGWVTRVGIYDNAGTFHNITGIYSWTGAECPPGATSPPDNQSINLTAPLPINESSFNVQNIGFNTTMNNSFLTNCSLYINDTLNQTTTGFSPGENQLVNYSVNFKDDGEYTYTIGCFDGTNDTNTSTNTFFMDFEAPEVVTDLVNNTFFFQENLTAQFNLTDNLLLHSVNVSIDDKLIFNETHVHENFFQVNISWNVSNLTLGKHQIIVRAADGHTAFELSADYDWSNGLWNDYMKYEFPEGGYVKTELKDSSIFDEWETERKIDRYTQTFYPSKPSDTQTFIEVSDVPIEIVEKPGHYKDRWLIIGEHWKDYVLTDEPDSVVSIKRINLYKVEVTISGIKNNPEKLVFNSLGDLNVVELTRDFYVINMTDDFDSLVISRFSFGINLSMDYGELLFDISGLTPTVNLQINDTNFSATELLFNESEAEYRKAFTALQNTFSAPDHKWYFDFGNLTRSPLETSLQSQETILIDVSQCNASNNQTILNITYIDESSDLIMNASNAYQLNITDGTYNYLQVDSFPRNETVRLCTNLNPSVMTYNWDLWGAFTLSEPDYITRIINIDESVPIQISNNPATQQTLFLIKTANSSTVTYNWFTSNFQLVTGTMRIFQCNDDGSQSLVESTPVISGVTTANIELLTQPYSYDIIIGGEVFSDTKDYSRCHVESATELTFFVETEVINIGPLIGLGAIPCSITKLTNTTVNMTWTENSQLAGYVQGCVIANRRSITGNVEVLNDCSVEADGYTRTVVIPVVEGNTYIITGELIQDGRTVICGGETLISPGDEAGGLFSYTGLLAAFFLVLALILMYSGEGESQLTGAGIGIVVAWILGILNWGWIVTSSIIVFLIIIALIGRHSRVSTPV